MFHIFIFHCSGKWFALLELFMAFERAVVIQIQRRELGQVHNFLVGGGLNNSLQAAAPFLCC
jgi:hypothetical protein